MPQYKLYYLDQPRRGRAFIPRLILVQAGVKFEDVRFNESEWAAAKTSMPFGKVPVLEIDGRMVAQSRAICRYLAKQHGLAGKDDWEQAQADMYGDNIADLLEALVPGYLEKDLAKQKEIYTQVLVDTVLPHAAIVENQLAKNKSGYLVGKQLTWADLAYFAYFAFVIEFFGEDSLKNTPLLKDLVHRVSVLPNISQWIKATLNTP